jgi:PAS domain S-box-containing protein
VDYLESQLRALMEALPYSSWFKDADGKFIQANNQLLQSLNLEIQDILGKLSREVFDKEDARQSEEGDREVLFTRKLSQANHSRDQHIFRTVNFPVLDSSGKISGIGGYQEDITNLTASLQSLHKEKEYLEALLEHMPLYIFFTDHNNKYIRINSMMAKLLRVDHPDEAVGKGNEVFFTKRVARKMLEENNNIIETGAPIINRIVYFEDDGVDGFWMEINKIPIRDERGIITMIVGIYKDISDLMKIETELKLARDQAQESDRLKTSFLANMSHEIRTPMNGIVGFANLLRDPDLSDDQKDLYLKHIDHSSNQLLHIIDDIIDISKIESGQLKISNKAVRINELLDEIYSSYFHRIRGDAPGQKKVTFNLKKANDSSDFTIVADDYRLRQIVTNLIDNSIKFTREGHITFGYELNSKRYIEFFVSDSGIGIPADKLDIIFDRFGQINISDSDQPSGTGLGLPISKSLANLMGGEMWVESTLGKGTTLFFTLPLVTEEAREETHIIISNKSYSWENKKILVAEDEELNWLFIREMLRKTGAEIIRARDGKEVVKIARKAHPDVILMDIKMPELNGIEATRKIRAKNKDVPIIAQTAYVMAEEKEECSRAGCNHFVTKPLDRTIIMELIDSYFKKK